MPDNAGKLKTTVEIDLAILVSLNARETRHELRDLLAISPSRSHTLLVGAPGAHLVPASDMPSSLNLRNILVPVDFSAASEQALEDAIAYAECFSGKITLVHVIESGRYVGDFTESDTGMTDIPRRVQERLRELVGESGRPGLFDRVEVRAGRPFHEISQAANELGSDLIVLSKHGHSALGYVLLGSTAERVVRCAPCPVLAVSREAARVAKPQNVLAPTDFSPVSFDGLRYALGLARSFGAKLTVMNVVERLGPLARLEADLRTVEKRLLGESQLRLERLHLEMNEPEGSFETLVAGGTNYHEIVKAAGRGHFDLVVMASHGRSRAADILLGSTAERVVRHASCPVLVVRESRGPRGPAA